MGYLTWESRFISGVPFLDGKEWTAQGIPLGFTWTEAEDGEAFIIATASGEHVLQSPIADDAASDQPPRYMFDLPVQLIDEEAYFRLLRAKRKGSVVQFVPYLWDEENYAGQTAGDVRSLARGLAWGVVGGVSSGTHPAIFFKNGVEAPSCAALSGTLSQVLTVAEDGDIAVRYMPVFNVVIRAVSGQFQDVGGATTRVQLEEVRRYA